MLEQEQNSAFYQELDENHAKWNNLQFKKTLLVITFFFVMISCLAWLVWQIFVLKADAPNFPLHYVQMYTGLAVFIGLLALAQFLIKRGEEKNIERWHQIMRQYQNC